MVGEQIEADSEYKDRLTTELLQREIDFITEALKFLSSVDNSAIIDALGSY